MLVYLVVAAAATVAPGSSYPVFGTKRYGRGPSWVVPVHHAYLPDYFYSPPVYRAPPPPSYYYPDGMAHSYGYYAYDDDMLGRDPLDDIQDEIQQEEEREEREEALPIGQETWYENSDDNNDNMADVNAIFLQNLILSQMYNDQMSMSAANRNNYQTQHQRSIALAPQLTQHYGSSPYSYYPLEQDGFSEHDLASGWVYGDDVGTDDYSPFLPPTSYDDQDVRDLKLLAKKMRRPWRTVKRGGHKKELRPRLEGSKSFSDRKAPATTVAPSTSSTTTMKPALDDKRRGMKEVAVPRPAAPPRGPRPARSQHSVYDTIRQLLSMEAGLDNKDVERPLQKRFVSSEDSLVEELGGLKKLAA